MCLRETPPEGEGRGEGDRRGAFLSAYLRRSTLTVFPLSLTLSHQGGVGTGGEQPRRPSAVFYRERWRISSASTTSPSFAERVTPRCFLADEADTTASSSAGWCDARERPRERHPRNTSGPSRRTNGPARRDGDDEPPGESRSGNTPVVVDRRFASPEAIGAAGRSLPGGPRWTCPGSVRPNPPCDEFRGRVALCLCAVPGADAPSLVALGRLAPPGPRRAACDRPGGGSFDPSDDAIRTRTFLASAGPRRSFSVGLPPNEPDRRAFSARKWSADRNCPRGGVSVWCDGGAGCRWPGGRGETPNAARDQFRLHPGRAPRPRLSRRSVRRGA
jgi:hypothetical protein